MTSQIQSTTESTPDGDLFELLFPESKARRDEGRRWAQLLGLLVHDARCPAAGSSGELDHARRALHAVDDRFVADALDVLLGHLFDALLDSTSCFALARTATSWDDAWRTFAHMDRSPIPPAPGTPLDVQARRWIEAYGELIARAHGDLAATLTRRHRAWELALARVVEGADALHAQLAKPGRDLPARIAELEAAALLALERGRPREARELLAGSRANVALDAGLVQLTRLVARLLSPEDERPVEWHGTVPEAWRFLLPDAPPNPRAPAGSVSAAPTRTDLGAVFVGIFLVGPNGRLELARQDVAPGLRARISNFQDERSHSWRGSDAPERRALERGVPDVQRGVHLDGVLAPATSRAVARVPLPLDGPAGWVHLEFEHRLAPGAGRLEVIAQAWSDELSKTPPIGSAASAERCTANSGARGRGGARLAFAEERLAQEATGAWYDVVLDQAVPIASGRQATMASAEALRRAIRLGLPQRGPADVEPLIHAGTVVGLLVRTPTFLAEDGAPSVATASKWQDARFVDWHQERFGAPVDPVAATASLDARSLTRIACARSDIELSGGEGSGRETLARRLVFERSASASLDTVHDAEGLLERLESQPNGGTVICRCVDRWPHRAQLLLATAPLHLRFIAIVERTLAAGVAQGQVAPALAARFARLTWRVPDLEERRQSIGPLAERLLATIGAAEGWPGLELDDEAQAFLWRQSWPGGVRQLEATLYRAALAGSLAEETLAALLEEQGVEPIRRLPTDSESELLAAIERTRLANGRENRRRAALYLGWDRDTVAARIRNASGTPRE